MARLTAAERKKIPPGKFGLHGKDYPLEDENHARNALARAAQHASPDEQETIKRKVHKIYPTIKIGGK